jgi:hypothetical protein
LELHSDNAIIGKASMEDGTEIPQEDPSIKKASADQENQARIAALWELRDEINEQYEREITERMRTNPSPTDIEKKLGTFIEELEPQIREPVLEFNSKGYMTDYAGFYGEECEQMIQGSFLLDDKTKNRLEAIGLRVSVEPNIHLQIDKFEGIERGDIPEEVKHTTSIRFHPEAADIQAIGAKWEQAAGILPDRGKPSVNYFPEHNFNQNI